MPKKKTTKQKTKKRESPYRKYIDEIDAVVNELNPNFDWRKYEPFARACIPNADGMARVRGQAFLGLGLKQLEEDLAARRELDHPICRGE